ncbi:hypothetical protein Sros01_03750 [Streptomyces roseochromogenus]|nr:hypothetical protein Sros01_03750 [Streptomyces roseochromogenus]
MCTRGARAHPRGVHCVIGSAATAQVEVPHVPRNGLGQNVVSVLVRRLVCGEEHRGRRTFAEQIPALTRRYARRTDALTDT